MKTIYLQHTLCNHNNKYIASDVAITKTKVKSYLKKLGSYGKVTLLIQDDNYDLKVCTSFDKWIKSGMKDYMLTEGKEVWNYRLLPLTLNSSYYC